MTIGIHALAACKEERTGVEEYCYQLIRHLAMLPEARSHRFLLYAKPGGRESAALQDLPKNFETRELWAPRFWTQVRLSLEMLRRAPHVLFIPAHALPLYQPARSVVTIHGLEFEYYPQHYPFFHLHYLRTVTRYAARHATHIIVPSENTKRDLVGLYGVEGKKITVIPFGVAEPPPDLPIPNLPKPYLFYLGRLETRKNVHFLIRAFSVVKKDKHLPHHLVLAGKPGYGFQTILQEISFSPYASDIHVLGYVCEREKWAFLKRADLFAFPSLSEGFGLPILEAQRAGTPVLTSRGSVCEGVAGSGGALLVDPLSVGDIARGIGSALTDHALCRSCVERGRVNAGMYSWLETAADTLHLLVRV